MKYTPGRYSVTLFCVLGVRLQTVWTDDEGEAFFSFHSARTYADSCLDEGEDSPSSYAIERVIMNSAADRMKH